jgi:hypothetical protein
MIRLLLAVLAAWAAWRYRDQIKESVNRLPHAQKSVPKVLGEATETIKEGLHARRPSAGRREG